MIEQGTDGLSRGDLTEGVIAGRSILDFVPLNKSALVCQPGLIPRLQSWIPASNPKFLQTPDWFNVGPAVGHEPLIIGLTLRFSVSSPWQTKFTTGVLEVERALSQVWSALDEPERHILFEFCVTPERLDGLSKCMV